MKLPLKISLDEAWIILDADDETVCEIDSQGTMADDDAIAAEIVAAVNGRAEMVALLRRVQFIFGNEWNEHLIIKDINDFLAKEPTP